MPITKFYTGDYIGENVSNVTSWRQGRKEDNMTWVTKTIDNSEHNGIAHVLGNGATRKRLDLNLLHGQKGGSAGVQSVGQSYGSNMLFTEFNPTFLICVNPEICRLLVKSGYSKKNIVLSNPKNIMEHPGEFHLYPHWQNRTAGALCAALACADGHKEIYLLGFDFYESALNQHIYTTMEKSYTRIENVDATNQKLEEHLLEVITTYDDVNFFRVVTNKKQSVPESFKWLKNYEQIELLTYINRTSLGGVAK